jgi:hypothetical protein
LVAKLAKLDELGKLVDPVKSSMPTKKAHYKNPDYPSRSVAAKRAPEARETSRIRARRLESIIVDTNVFKSMKRPYAEALKKVINLISEGKEDSPSRAPGVRLVIGMDHQRRIPKFEIEDAGSEQPGSDDLDAALAEARERGVSRAVEILSRGEMLSAADFAKFIGVSREAVRAKHQRNEVLGLKGAKRGLRFPKWQVTSNGGLLPDLPRIFDLLGGDSWTVYRFLTQDHPELEGGTALSALLRGKVEKVLVAAENTAGAFS